jgi:predicted pyridoxine 5'-phosphate oxidase superfamily flavin-nucleotide-binding protein
MDPGPLLATTHDAAGLRVRLRLARPSDALRLGGFLERHAPRLAAHARQFTFFDPRERLVVLATAPLEGSEEIVGLADLAAPEKAEPLVLVDDRTPSHAVRRLLEQSAAALATRLWHAA